MKRINLRLPDDLAPVVKRFAQEQRELLTAKKEGLSYGASASFPSPLLERPNGRSAPTMSEVGITGLLQTGGFIFEEFEPHLRGDKALQIYIEMISNSPVVQAVMFAIDMMMRQVSWRVEQGGEKPEDIKARDFVESCMHDMSQSWQNTLSEILSMLWFGFSYHEIVYKVRKQSNPLKPGSTSQYDDGMIGWRKIPIRAQITRWRWEFDEAGGIRGMWQAPWGLGGGITAGTQLRAPVFIPIEKALLFRPRQIKNNPEGWSLLRSAYRPWFYAKRLEEIEAIGMDRDLAGYPVGKIPAEHIVNNTPTYQNWKQTLRNIRRGEQEALIVPSDVDAESKMPLYSLELLSATGRRKVDCGPAIERYNRLIAMTMLADFLFLGQGGGGRTGGSFALVSNRADLFGLALNAILDSVAETFNRHAVPRLLYLNNFTLDDLPRIVHDEVEIPDIEQLSAGLANLAKAGMPLFPDVDLENRVRAYMGLPELSEDEVHERRQVDPTPGVPLPTPPQDLYSDDPNAVNLDSPVPAAGVPTTPRTQPPQPPRRGTPTPAHPKAKGVAS